MFILCASLIYSLYLYHQTNQRTKSDVCEYKWHVHCFLLASGNPVRPHTHARPHTNLASRLPLWVAYWSLRHGLASHLSPGRVHRSHHPQRESQRETPHWSHNSATLCHRSTEGEDDILGRSLGNETLTLYGGSDLIFPTSSSMQDRDKKIDGQTKHQNKEIWRVDNYFCFVLFFVVGGMLIIVQRRWSVCFYKILSFH